MAGAPAHAATARLLREVFPGARVGDERYLDWLYEQSPFGPVIATDHDDEQGRAAHYAVVPVALSVDGKPVEGALSLNTAVHERARGGGMFVRLAQQTYDAAAQRGVRVIIGVANANSTPGFLRRLEFVTPGALPVTVLLPTPGSTRGFRSAPAGGDGAALSAEASALLDGADALLAPGATGLERTWTPDTLRWRLVAPGASYAVHRHDDVLAISTCDRRGPLRVGVLLAVLAARPVKARTVRGLVREVCRFHRAPVGLHVGFNDRARFRGVPLPDRLKDSPLNLIVRTLDGSPAPAAARVEFLDFDAY